MSQKNLEIVRAALEAINRADWGALFKYAAPGFEYDASRAVGPVHGVLGLDQCRRTLGEFTEQWESMRYEAEEFLEAGEHVVTPFTHYLRGRDGIEVQARAVFVWTLRRQGITRLCLYQERHEALEAAGLRE